MSVGHSSGTQLEQNELLCVSGRAKSHPSKLKSQYILDDPRQDAKSGVDAVRSEDAIPVETQSPPQQAGASTQKALPTEDPTSRNSHEAEHWSNHSASGQSPPPSPRASDQNDICSGKQQLHVGSSTEVSERKQANNREHQRRWRLRQKVRSTAVQKQLASAAAELAELKAKQEEMEARTQHLGRSPSTKRQIVDTFISKGSPDGEPFVPLDDMDSNNQPVLTISLGGRRQTTSAEEVRSLTLQQFAALWTAYNSELQECLLHLSWTTDEGVQTTMQQLALEALRLAGCRLLMNPAEHSYLITGRMNHGHEAQHSLDHAFFVNLLILLALSDEQVQDIMLLRQLYHNKLALLSMERKELVNQMAMLEQEEQHPAEHVVTVSDLSKCLKDNVDENHQTLYRVARVLYRGILTTRQLADVVVHSYPYMPITETLVDTIASQYGYPSKDDIRASAHLDPMIAEWELFSSYAKFIGSQKLSHNYIQLCKHGGTQEQS
ncbi:hypothetical protein WJX77_007619 [Trebouxia sp. C0004]